MLLVTSTKFTFAIIVGRTMWYDNLCFSTWNRPVPLNENGCASFDRFVSPALIVLTNDVLVSIRERVHENGTLEIFPRVTCQALVYVHEGIPDRCFSPFLI